MHAQIAKVWKPARGKLSLKQNEVRKLMELHAKIARDEDANGWGDETRAYLKSLIKAVRLISYRDTNQWQIR